MLRQLPGQTRLPSAYIACRVFYRYRNISCGLHCSNLFADASHQCHQAMSQTSLCEFLLQNGWPWGSDSMVSVCMDHSVSKFLVGYSAKLSWEPAHGSLLLVFRPLSPTILSPQNLRKSVNEHMHQICKNCSNNICPASSAHVTLYRTM